MASTITTFSHLQIPLEEVLEATNNFNDKNIIGRGGLGTVYKGKLFRSEKLVEIAARRLDSKHKQGIEFWTEISALSSLKHENIVSFIGFCDEKGEKVIINKHEAKGSLVRYLSNPSLTWFQRLKISVGVARALRYIHNGDDGRSYSVIHRNINSSMILLDDKFEAKLSGFEYSINHSVHRMDQVLISEAIGTTGYMDPEIEKTGGVTHKSDIYSFGVVLLELICKRKAFIPNGDERFLVPLVKFHVENNSTMDKILGPSPDEQMADESLKTFLSTAFTCVNEERAQRQDMNYIVHELEKALELQLPNQSLPRNVLEHSHMKIRLADIMLATDNFSKAYIIQRTEFYDLYRAELEYLDKEDFASVEENNKSEQPKRRVIIKRLHPVEDKKGEDEFFTNIEMLTTCKHRNIATLLGFCDEGLEKILVLEDASNGYLYDYLTNHKDKSILTWEKRLKICLDVACGLQYLHHEMEDQKVVINRNLTTDAIALDENLGAKIVNFGYAVFLPPNQYDDALYLKLLYGTPLYIDPEYYESGKLKRESDVYNFGVILFEMLCGRIAGDKMYLKESEDGLVYVARRCYRNGTLNEVIDPIIKEERSDNNCISTKGPNKDSIYTFVKIAYFCVAETQKLRPTMKLVVEELKKALSFQMDEQCQDSDHQLILTHENAEHSNYAAGSPTRNNLEMILQIQIGLILCGI